MNFLKQYKLYLFLITILAMAMSKTIIDSSQSTAYHRLISKELFKIATLEEKQGTYEHQDYFTEQANHFNKTPHVSLPRIARYNNVKRHKKEIRKMRDRLERAMVGFQKKYAPEAVAKMHAAYLCRTKNIGVNHRMDTHCKDIFEQYAQTAETIVDQKGSNNVSFLSKISQMPPRMKKANTKKESFPSLVQKPLLSRNKVSDIGNAIRQKEKEIVIYNKRNIHNLPAPVLGTKKETASYHKPFNPLKHVHPTLTSAKTTEDTKQDFGLKQIGKIKVLKQPLITHLKKDIPLRKVAKKSFSRPKKALTPPTQVSHKKINIHPNFLGKNTEFDPVATASIDQKAVQKSASYSLVVPFTKGGVHLSKKADKTLRDVKKALYKTSYKTVKITGHADKGISNNIDNKISFKRAYTVFEALQKDLKRTHISDIKINGLGHKSPILAYKATDNRNRRVVIELIK